MSGSRNGKYGFHDELLNWDTLLHYSISPGRVLDAYNNRYTGIPRTLHYVPLSYLKGCSEAYVQCKEKFLQILDFV